MFISTLPYLTDVGRPAEPLPREATATTTTRLALGPALSVCEIVRLFPPVELPLTGVPTPMVKCEMQLEFTQNGAPAVHLVRQLPHALGSFVTSRSQPSSRSVLQSPQPAVQAVEQAPPVQLGVPWFELHLTPQPPQLLMSLLTGSSQPSVWLVLQWAKPVLQVSTWQLPDTQL